MNNPTPLPKIAALSLIASLISLKAGYGLPQYAVRYGQTCGLCHINPGGGGMRNLYGAQFFSYMDLPWKELDDFGKLEEFNPQFSRHFQLGADFRGQYFTSSDKAEGNSFLTMQGDLYLTLSPVPQALFYVDRGLYGGFEAFALFQGLPYGGTFKMGRFVPSFGWRFVDHKSYTREYSELGLRGEEDGVEMGVYTMPGEISLSLTNGKPGGLLDPDRGKRLYLRGAIRTSWLGVNVTGGISGRWGELPLGNGAEPAGRRSHLGGIFWGVNAGSLTYLGEMDVLSRQEKMRELTTTHLVNIRPYRGWEGNFTYDFRDPNLLRRSGVLSRLRLSMDFYPTGFFSLGLAGERKKETGRKAVWVGETMLHFWF